MQLLPDLLLFLLTLVGGLVPIMVGAPDERKMHLLLAFSGSFLLGITCLHLLPETFIELPERAGIYLLAGFFLQLLIQRATHGVEHGHAHVHGHDHDHDHDHDHSHSIPVFGILAGLSVHAFMEGLPLGFNYRNAATSTSLFLAVGAHKLPEAMLLGVLLSSVFSRGKAIAWIVVFAFITPCAAILSGRLGVHYSAMARTVTALIPVVAGAFIHISTTIFFESGTKQHMLTSRKVAAMVAGVVLAALTLLFE